MKQVIRFETQDGQLFATRNEAQRHERALKQQEQRRADTVDIDNYWVPPYSGPMEAWIRRPGLITRH
jgi:hypothetical protein